MDFFYLDFTLKIYGIKIMNTDRTLYQIKAVLEKIDQSLYNLAFDINKLTRKILEEDEKKKQEDNEERF